MVSNTRAIHVHYTLTRLYTHCIKAGLYAIIFKGIFGARYSLSRFIFLPSATPFQWIFLPSAGKERQLLNLPPKQRVDYRAACFCHRHLVEIGFVCSVCLSS